MNAIQTQDGLDSNFITVDGVKIHYLSSGSGHPVLFIHGWPTNALLWRNVMPIVAANRRALAIDLPGFGLSDKPTDRKYSFKFYSKILSGFIEALGLDRLDIVVHDLGGPVGLHWAVNNPDRVSSIVLLNTLVFSKLSWAAKAFLIMTRLPIANRLLVSEKGLEYAMRVGVSKPSRLERETLALYKAPYQDNQSKLALLKSVQSLHPNGLKEIENKLVSLDVPIRMIYGEKDRILPDVSLTMSKLQSQIKTKRECNKTVLQNAGHFLQEDEPKELARLIKQFLAENVTV